MSMKYVYPYNSCYINLFIIYFFAIENNSDSSLLRQNYTKSIIFTCVSRVCKHEILLEKNIFYL